MTQATADFEAGVNGNTVATGDTGSATQWNAVNIVASGTIAYDNTHKYGTLSCKFATGATSGQVFLTWSTALGTLTDHYGRTYLWLPSLPAATLGLLLFRNTGTVAARIRVKTDGKVEFLDKDGTVVATSTNALSTGQFVRLEWHVVHAAGAGSIECKIFNSPDSGTATETLTATSLQTLSQSNELLFGQTTNTSNMPAFWVDNVVAGAVAYPGPVVVGNSYTGTRQNAVLELCDAGITGSYENGGSIGVLRLGVGRRGLVFLGGSGLNL